MMETLQSFAFAIMATAGFAIILRVPSNKLLITSIIGGFAWVAYLGAKAIFDSPTAGCFIGALLVGLISGSCAKYFKEAATVFIVPGIIVLVPGAYIYFTMESILNHEIHEAAEYGIQTVMMAGAIAMGLLVAGTVVLVIRLVYRKTVRLRDHLWF